ncbi:MAG: 50S ribosomal protein L2 [Candidatus Altiarchaeales archaeon WOR_SM1_86-2]|nr:MAG: 50S ribosomal protein L2 [Candidatus Altiarchaeales archaeon WOR_SM1_86-2]
MGKRLIQQRRGKGTPRYRAPSHRFKSDARYPRCSGDTIKGQVVGIVTDAAHSCPLMRILLDGTFEEILMLAPREVRVGQWIEIGSDARPVNGNVLQLKSIPEGTSIYNIELLPGDGGKLVRTSGTSAYLVSHEGDKANILLPSKKNIMVNGDSRATIGKVAGGGRVEKPFARAGRKHHAKKAKGKLYPITGGVHMNAIDHPFGGKASTIGKSTTVSRYASPGRKVGHISARQTGRKKGRK